MRCNSSSNFGVITSGSLCLIPFTTRCPTALIEANICCVSSQSSKNATAECWSAGSIVRLSCDSPVESLMVKFVPLRPMRSTFPSSNRRSGSLSLNRANRMLTSRRLSPEQHTTRGLPPRLGRVGPRSHARSWPCPLFLEKDWQDDERDFRRNTRGLYHAGTAVRAMTTCSFEPPRMNLSTAKPSFPLLPVTTSASRRTSGLALPMEMLRSLRSNIAISAINAARFTSDVI
jgi:hypothetical protein